MEIETSVKMESENVHTTSQSCVNTNSFLAPSRLLQYSTPLTIGVIFVVLLFLIIFRIEGAEELLMDMMRTTYNKTINKP